MKAVFPISIDKLQSINKIVREKKERLKPAVKQRVSLREVIWVFLPLIHMSMMEKMNTPKEIRAVHKNRPEGMHHEIVDPPGAVRGTMDSFVGGCEG